VSAGDRTLLEAVEEVARLAGEHALAHFGKTLVVEDKADGSPVTIADRGAEQIAREWIARRFPQDGVLGEEFGVTNPDARRRWILDPIDGTKSFIRGVPLWGTLVAVAEGHDVLAGAACFPAVGERVAAARGAGCWWNGRRCAVSTVADLAHATVLTTDERFPQRRARHNAWDELAQLSAVARTWGDCYGYLLVATGRAEVMVDDVVAAWDAAAILPIVEEAGGVVTDWTGARTAFGGDVIATNAALAAPVRRILLDQVAALEHPSPDRP
jgi:histidinol phosphatase-like enzyme (inositol monophosphatase family)